jgi:hypothetical protein
MCGKALPFRIYVQSAYCGEAEPRRWYKAVLWRKVRGFPYIGRRSRLIKEFDAAHNVYCFSRSSRSPELVVRDDAVRRVFREL